MKTITLLLISLSIGVSTAFAQGADKITVADLVAKHLASIGSPEARDPKKSRVLVGQGTVTAKIGSAFVLSGTAQLASMGSDSLFALILNSPQYPYDKAAFDGKDVSLGLPNGQRSMLTSYFKTRPVILQDGLFMGTLSTAWPLLDLDAHPKVKLEMAGTTKIDDQVCYKVKYTSGHTGDMKATLYFDAKTFRLVRSEYEYEIGGSIGTSSTDVRSRSRTERYRLTEDFSDFKTAGKLTLPFRYKVNITTEGQIETTSGTLSRDWAINILEVYFDQALTPEMFHVS